jgi:hypothetical protein
MTDVDPARAKSLAGISAERFAADRVAEWRHGKEDAYRKAHDGAEKARREHRENAVRLAALEQQQREGPALTAVVAKPMPPPPPMMDNPVWLDLQRQVADLEGRRDQLLIDRTELHPAVQEVEGRIAEIKAQLAATARQIPDNRVKHAPPAETPAIVPPPIDDLATKEYKRKLGELTAALEKSRLTCEDAERIEKQAGQGLAAAPHFAFERPEAVQNPPPVDYGWRRLLWATFASSLLMVFGVVTFSFGAGIDPPVACVEDVEEELDESILGILPFEGPSLDVAAIERQVRLRRAAIALGTVLILACPVVAAWGVLGI